MYYFKKKMIIVLNNVICLSYETGIFSLSFLAKASINLSPFFSVHIPPSVFQVDTASADEMLPKLALYLFPLFSFIQLNTEEQIS